MSNILSQIYCSFRIFQVLNGSLLQFQSCELQGDGRVHVGDIVIPSKTMAITFALYHPKSFLFQFPLRFLGIFIIIVIIIVLLLSCCLLRAVTCDFRRFYPSLFHLCDLASLCLLFCPCCLSHLTIPLFLCS